MTTAVAVSLAAWGPSAPIVCAVAMQAGVAQQKAPQQKQPPANSAYGQTIFSRTATTASNAAPPQATPSALAKPSATALVTDAERSALTYRSYDFEVHLVPSRHSLAVHAHLDAQNTSDKPLTRIALQLSSSLHWYSIRVDGATAKFQTETVDSDIDHTGQLTEAVVVLTAPIAPGTTIHLDVIYSGTVEQSSERLLRLGAPPSVAASSEWDEISPDFTALRGFGNVIWFPVSTAPVLLGQGPQMFDSVGKWKLRESDARIKMHVLVEYLDVSPNVAFLNGRVVPPGNSPAPEKSSPPATSSSAAFPADTGDTGNTVLQVVSFTLPSTTLGFSPLSFLVMNAASQHFPNLDIYTRHGNETAAPVYAKIVESDRPLIEQWLGPHPRRPVVLVDLPASDDLPFEERNLLFLPLQANASSDSAGPVMAHMLSHSYFVSPRPWLNEGMAQFMTLLWIEQRAGRATAISQMDSRRAALALAETTDPGIDPGQSLIEAWSDIYYRDKAADVLWMLRDMVGDTPFANALRAYNPADDREPSYLQHLLQKSSGKDLEWFFDDWIYRDRGLPDLHIASAYRRPILTKNSAIKNYLVSVDVRNDSFCSAEIPVTVQSELATQTKRLLVPAHGDTTVRMLVDSQPSQVTVNDGSVPEVRTSNHERAIVPAQ
ncbi:MAG: M1 family aminopeptidase [Acidobacteriaceae bacterium]